MLSIYTRIQMAKEDVEKLKQIIKKMPRDISMFNFSERMCTVCPLMCSECDFCFMLFKYSTAEGYEKILKQLVFFFYHGIDISNFTYFIYSICPICELNCGNVYSDNDCPYDYMKQLGEHRPIFGNNGGLQTFKPKSTTVSYDHKKGILVRKRNNVEAFLQLRPQIISNGETMEKIVNKLWGVNENNSKEWGNNT